VLQFICTFNTTGYKEWNVSTLAVCTVQSVNITATDPSAPVLSSHVLLILISGAVVLSATLAISLGKYCLSVKMADHKIATQR